MNAGLKVANGIKEACQYCGKVTNRGNLKKHENACYLNPEVLRECVVCGEPIKNYKSSKGTCSYSCSNVHFAHLRNKDEKLGYQALCFRYHGKKCIVCGEDKIVAAHHVDENHDNNDPENLIPLCPTHHSYMHSRYKSEILPLVEEYLAKRKCGV